MSQFAMTRWIEIADERHFCEDATFARTPQALESHFLHLGENILKVAAKAGSYVLACGRCVAALQGNRVNAERPDDHFGGELTLSDLLDDPIAQALMAVDHVDRPELDTVLDAARGNL